MNKVLLGLAMIACLSFTTSCQTVEQGWSERNPQAAKQKERLRLMRQRQIRRSALRHRARSCQTLPSKKSDLPAKSFPAIPHNLSSNLA